MQSAELLWMNSLVQKDLALNIFTSASTKQKHLIKGLF